MEMMRTAMVALVAAPLTGCMIIAVEHNEPLSGYSRGTISETYQDVEKIEIETVSGNCKIETSPEPYVEVQVKYDVRPAGAVEPVMRFQRDRGLLVLNENWEAKSSSGDVHWLLIVPQETAIDYSSASGDFTAEGLEGSVRVRTSSGNVVVKNSTGLVDIHSSSGNITTQDCTGQINTSSVRGKVSG